MEKSEPEIANLMEIKLLKPVTLKNVLKKPWQKPDVWLLIYMYSKHVKTAKENQPKKSMDIILTVPLVEMSCARNNFSVSLGRQKPQKSFVNVIMDDADGQNHFINAQQVVPCHPNGRAINVQNNWIPIKTSF